jgi:hypothetical protein
VELGAVPVEEAGPESSDAQKYLVVGRHSLEEKGAESTKREPENR